MIIEPDVLRRLEWDLIQLALAGHTRTPMGHERALVHAPLDDDDAIERLHDRVHDLRTLRRLQGSLPIAEVADPAPVLAILRVRGKTLTGLEIYETLRLLVVAREVRQALAKLEPESYGAIAGDWARFPEAAMITNAIEGNVTGGGDLEDHASPELTRLRREIRQLSDGLRGTLEAIVREEWPGPVLRDGYVTMRNERYVLPVRTDTPRRFEGIVHGHSGTEKTVFIEPMETVEINNRLVRLRDEERQEVDRILAAWTALLRENREVLETSAFVLGEIDMHEAIASWADAEDAVRPQLVSGGGLRLRHARHLGLEASLRRMTPPRRMVPLDVDLPRELHGLVISGPNAGGKTVALKTIGLVAILAHAGMPIPAEDAQVPLLTKLFADIGDEQSIEGSLSTFSSHVRNLATMVRDAGPRALCLIDEIGTGTDPAEGAALGAAVLERLLREGAHVVATTHHAAIKAWAYRTPGTVNAACEFDEATMRPTYRLVPGVAGSSIGLTMAEQLGLDAAVVDDARRRLDPSGAEAARALDSVRALAQGLEAQRAEVVEERRRLRAETDALRARTKEDETKRKREWEARVEALAREFRERADRIVRQMQDKRTQRTLDIERARRERELREAFSEEAKAAKRQEPPPTDWTPAEGAKVYVASLGKEGTVRTLKGAKADIVLGRSVFTVPVSDLRPQAGAAEPALEDLPVTKPRRPELPGGVTADLESKEVARELHLLGMRVEEALDELDKYLDDASLAGLAEVRIVHGFGTGRLKKAVREHLSQHPLVARWREGEPDEGGGGATVAIFQGEL